VRDDIRTTAIIPLVGPHVRFMRRLLSNVSSSTAPFYEIVVVASGLTFELSSRLNRICAEFPNLPIKVVSAPLAPAGTNRNIGIENSDGNWVTFLDADDLYLPNRVDRLITAAIHYGAAAVGHDYSTFRSPLVGSLKLSFSQVRGAGKTAAIPTATAIDSRDFVTSADGASTNVTTLRLHHAHILVRRDVFTHLRFSNTPGRNEDGIFLRGLIEQGKKFIRVDERLSIYYLGSRLRKLTALMVSTK
jgi:glycosyltransferase involved in cell wall biosynthesis